MFVFFAADEGSLAWDLIRLLAVPLLVGLNGLFVAAEFALVAVRRTQVEEMVRHGQKGARALMSAVSHLDRSIAATQLGITLASLALGWLGEPAIAHLLEPVFQSLPGPWATVSTHSVAAAIAFMAITFMHVVFGELVPKSLALQSPDRTALWVVKPLLLFARMTRPLIVVMNGTGNLIIRLLGFKPAADGEMVHSLEELAMLIEDTEEAGLIEPDQAEFVQNVFRLSDKRVSECMVPRERMAALELHMQPEKVLEAVRSGAHTRMPVYEGTLDNVVGIVNTKDLFYLFSLQGVVVLHDALYPPLYLKADETLDDALRLFKRAKRPMALVRDDEGKVQGLLTLEDILEEIVGDIEDEHDQTKALRARWRNRYRRRGLAIVPVPRPATSPPPAKK